MMNQRICLTGLLMLGGWQLIAASAVSANYDKLLKNSPFNPPATPVVPVREPGTLELRGVLVEKGEFLFSIHDKATHSSRWVGLKESGLPYVIERYDSRTGQAFVSQRDKLYALALPAAKLLAANPAATDPRRPVAGNESPWSAEAIAATWRGDLEGDYLRSLQSPGGVQ